MIHHVSIPAKNPRHVADVMAELLGGTVTRFGPYHDSFIALAGDEHGTALEIFPAGTELFLDAAQGQTNFRHNGDHSEHTATHVALSVKLDKESVMALAERESWRARELSRGSFRVIEFWIENRLMLEVLTPEMTAEYLECLVKRN